MTMMHEHLSGAFLQKALVFARDAHKEHKRKYSGEPYIVHPISVSKIVSDYGGTKDQIASALLHDVVEDCGVSLAEVERMFGGEVRRIVAGLTDISKPEDGNRATRKKIDREHILSGEWDVLMVKLADMLDNGRDIQANDPDFAVVYMQEMRALLRGMEEKVKGRCGGLFAVVEKMVDDYFAVRTEKRKMI